MGKLGLHSMDGRRLRGDLTEWYKIMRRIDAINKYIYFYRDGNQELEGIGIK